MVAIPLPVSTFPGERPQEGAGRLINCRAEPLGESGRAAAVRHRVPGLKSFGTSSESTFRGALLNGSTLYVAFDGVVKKLTSAGGAVAAVDTLDGDDRVFFARNNKRTTPDIMIVCQAGAFTLASDNIADLNDSDLPAPTDVCFLDGYFFFGIADGRCFASGLNATTVNSNDFITAEAKSDTLYRVIPWNGQLLICSSSSVEVWAGQPVNAAGFPFNRVAVIQRGIAGQGAISGHEDGFGKGLLFVGDDNAVHQLDGYAPTKVSPPDLDRLIEAVSDKDNLDASVYIVSGQPIWALSCDDWTWEFNLATRKWNERRSYQLSRWRGSRSFYAFGKWMCGDTESGNIGEISRTTFTEFGEPLIAEVWSAPVHAFPRRVRCNRADFDFSPGVGITGVDPNETDPQVEISHSDDGGYSFSNPRIRQLGKQGKAKTRVTVINNGMTGAQGRIWKIRMSDQAHFGLMAGDMSAEIRTG
jgi:hypothetical protein